MAEEKIPRVSNNHPAPGLWERKWLLVLPRDEGAWKEGQQDWAPGRIFLSGTDVLRPLSRSAPVSEVSHPLQLGTIVPFYR